MNSNRSTICGNESLALEKLGSCLPKCGNCDRDFGKHVANNVSFCLTFGQIFIGTTTNLMLFTLCY